MDAELGEDVLDMMPHRVPAQIEMLGNLPVRGSPREQTRDLRLAFGQSEPREAQLCRDLLIVREAHGHAYFERGKQKLEQCARSGSRTRASRAHRRLRVAVRDT